MKSDGHLECGISSVWQVYNPGEEFYPTDIPGSRTGVAVLVHLLCHCHVMEALKHTTNTQEAGSSSKVDIFGESAC